MIGQAYEEIAARANTNQGRRTDLGNFSQNSGRSQDAAAKAVGVSHQSITVAKAIKRDAPDLAAKVLFRAPT